MNAGGAAKATVTMDRVRDALGEAVFDERVAAGAAMELADAVRYAREHVQHARRQQLDSA